MNEIVTPESSRFERPPENERTDLRVVPDPGNIDNTKLSIHTLTNPFTNPIVGQVDTAILDNHKLFDGVTLAGDTIAPNSETLLRGVRKVITIFDEYRDRAGEPSDKLLKDARHYLSGRRKQDAHNLTILQLTNGAHGSVFELFMQLAAENDPLAVTLARLHKKHVTVEKTFHELALNSFAAFQLARFKPIVEVEIKRRSYLGYNTDQKAAG